jgi:hypothetical protein
VNPITKTVCGSIGAGGSAGKNVAAGPVIGITPNGQMASPSQIDEIFKGWSANVGFNVPLGPIPVGPGLQGSVNGSGAALGPNVGVAGFSISSTYAICTHY